MSNRKSVSISNDSKFSLTRLKDSPYKVNGNTIQEIILRRIKCERSDRTQQDILDGIIGDYEEVVKANEQRKHSIMRLNDKIDILKRQDITRNVIVGVFCFANILAFIHTYFF